MSSNQDRTARRRQQHAARRRARGAAAVKARRKRRRAIAYAAGGLAIGLGTWSFIQLAAATSDKTDDPAVASSSVIVVGDEFSFAPAISQGIAGEIEVTLKNEGLAGHELVILEEGVRISTKSQFNEATSLGKIPSIAPGSESTLTLDLQPGLYQVVCLLPGHLEAGMTSELVVQ